MDAQPGIASVSSEADRTALRPLIDPFGRRITYLRLSVTDRCDLRCRYCMPARPHFLPKSEVLSLEELVSLADVFIAHGVTKIRLTGGEPLVRKGIAWLITALGERHTAGLRELTITTNGQQLTRFLPVLTQAGMRRINISLDTLDPDGYARITRGGALAPVLEGIRAARDAGLAVKLNTVVMRGVNEGEIDKLIAFAGTQGCDLTLIEPMPLGSVEDGPRSLRFTPLIALAKELARRWTLTPLPGHSTGGPARYVRVEETGRLLGFITPLSHNFCAGCNRVRVSATGQLYLCLGAGDGFDLKRVLRREGPEGLSALLDRLIRAKPARHAFEEDMDRATPTLARHMHVTGG